MKPLEIAEKGWENSTSSLSKFGGVLPFCPILDYFVG